MFKQFIWTLLVTGSIALAQVGDTCTIDEKVYNQSGFDEGDFVSVDQGVLVGADLSLDTNQKLDLEKLVLGLDQPFFVDYLSEGAGASHLFGFFFFDIDTDKDGIPDFFETGDLDDLDGDGLVNQDDMDDDNDGIADTSDNRPPGVVNSMPPEHFRMGVEAAAAGSHANDYWQFVPNSIISGGAYSGYFEHPGAYLYVDDNANEVPDVLEYSVGANKIPPLAVDRDFDSRHISKGDFKGLWVIFVTRVRQAIPKMINGTGPVIPFSISPMMTEVQGKRVIT